MEPVGENMTESSEFDGEFVLAHGRDRLPLTYTLQAVKTAP